MLAVAPWGRIVDFPRKDMVATAAAANVEGDNGNAAKFWDWCERQVAAFL